VTTRGTHGSGGSDDEVVLGVDTHLDFHVAVVLDRLGRRLGEVKVPTTTATLLSVAVPPYHAGFGKPGAWTPRVRATHRGSC